MLIAHRDAAPRQVDPGAVANHVSIAHFHGSGAALCGNKTHHQISRIVALGTQCYHRLFDLVQRARVGQLRTDDIREPDETPRPARVLAGAARTRIK
eukprot:6828120-Prymnesium_polylepis.2